MNCTLVQCGKPMAQEQQTDGDTALRLQAAPGLGEAFRVWAGIGVMSFGGPAAQIALMHRVTVDERRWVDERRFLTALNFCMLLPGPEAMQLATYIGWRMHGVVGGLIAGLLFVLPGAALILLLASLYMLYGAVPIATALFLGIKAAVLAIVVEALLKVSRRALKGKFDIAIAAAAFVAIFFVHLPFPAIVALAAAVGFLSGSLSANPLPTSPADEAVSVPGSAWRSAAATAGIWLAIWLLPLFLLALVLGKGHVLVALAWFFSKLAVVTFGGAYAVLAYMAQEVVGRYQWLTAGEMLDALGLAETTPGPLILVTEFVGALAAGRQAGEISLAMAAAGAIVTLWATFAPCFLWVFTGAPFVERIAAMPRLRSALQAVTAAVVGVILNLTVWFAIKVLFEHSATTQIGPFRFLFPDVATVRPSVLFLTLVAMVMMFVAHRGIATTLAACALMALGLNAIGWL